MISFDDSELDALAVELPKLSAVTQRATLGVFREAAHELKTKWAANARETSGTHAKHYPNSITWDQKFSTDMVFEIGPDESRLQGKLGDELEFGTATSPAHLDGQRAADLIVPLLERRILLAAEGVFDA